MAKARGPHRYRRLTALMVRSVKEPGKYHDGDGLALKVGADGSKRWHLRVTFKGRRRDLGLGAARHVPLAEARVKADDIRRMVRAGVDPVLARRKERRPIPTLEEACRAVHGERLGTWRNEEHAAEWLRSLERFIFPAIGARSVDTIEPHDLLKVLSPIWLTRGPTASRVLQRLSMVFDWCSVHGHRLGNPCAGLTKALPKQTAKREHFAALPHAELPALMARLDDRDMPSLGLKLLILSAARSGEVLFAKWSEIDPGARLWTVPQERQKSGREHVVPLSDQALAVLDRARALAEDMGAGGSDYIFPGVRGGAISNMGFARVLKRLGVNVTTHGFRSSFRDWCSERNVNGEVAERALAHTVKDKTEAAYRRSTLIDARRDLMARWADYLIPPADKVVPIRRSA